MKRIIRVLSRVYSTKLALAFLFLVCITFWVFIHIFRNGNPFNYITAQVLAQTSHLPHPTPMPTQAPLGWVSSDVDTTVKFGSVKVSIPAGFIEGNGANVLGNTNVDFSSFSSGEGIIDGSELALYVLPWGANKELIKPLQLKFILNAAVVDVSLAEKLVVRIYEQDDGQWHNLPSRFDHGTYSIIASLESLRPVQSDISNLMQRSLLALFISSNSESPTSGGTDQGASTSNPTANGNANLRAGPGTDYDVIGRVASGQAILPVAASEDGAWYKLDNEAWIASFLVENAGSLPIETVQSSGAPVTVATSNAIPTVKRYSNLRAGPSLSYHIAGLASPGQILELNGISSDGEWLRLESGEWIAEFLVDNVPSLPVVSSEDVNVSNDDY